MSEYIIHGTSIENLNKILKDKYIKIKPNKKNRMFLSENNHQNINQIFTQLIFKNIPNSGFQDPHWLSHGIVLRKQILKDLPFYATDLGRFSYSFDNAMKRKDLLAKGNGNLKKYPDLKQLKTHIKNYVKKNKYRTGFTHSHEILFNQNISLEKYCVCIIVKGNFKNEKIINNLKIPIIYREIIPTIPKPGKEYNIINEVIDEIKKINK